ncbi:Transcriptional adapter ada2 [Clydaea vesicula]|uniref:Transcriptional adapter 2 n=1 Tax=Clydaea vesicula TaxID=447962 RepID=A0AAD5Y0P5_9FUNG|nr:Transcriptional adapter ada2 [Clydaea vesicula]KAJ3384301.1 Transcriptional adapter ada2 [Lobulomyces angularis]
MTIILKKRKYVSDETEELQNEVEIGQKYHCDNCEKDITSLVRIRCAECVEFDLCVECFSSGVEIKEHKNDHKYKVMDILDFPLFDPDWAADEELMLIEGLEMFGLGNWEQISDSMMTKTKEECAQHYKQIYIDSADWPLPDMTKKFDVATMRRSCKPLRPEIKKQVKVPTKPVCSLPHNHDISGYMPARGDFDVEYEDNSEDKIKEMVFEEDESEEDKLLKVTVLEIYNKILDHRRDRKNFIFERNLVDFKKIQSQDKKRSAEEKEVLKRCRPFARLQTAEDFENLTEGLINELKLRKRIAELQELKKMGIQTSREALDYRNQKNVRDANYKSTMTRDSYMTHHGERNIPSKYSQSTLNKVIKLDEGSRSSTPTKSSRPHTPESKKSAHSLDISQSEGYELLSSQEKTLCSSLRILPRAYLVIKETLLSHHQKSGGKLKKRQARGLVKIDVNKTGKVWDFFIQSGWI